MKRAIGVILLAAVLFGSSGCTTYLGNRARDAGEVIDLGLTVSDSPCFAAFVIFPPVHLTAVGYGKVDGWFAGLGGGKGRLFCPYYEKSVGVLIWGYETVSFGKGYKDLEPYLAKDKEMELAKQCTYYHTGAMGLAEGPPLPPEDYSISCPHYIHFGFIGVVLSPRYSEIADLVTGFFGMDMHGDDLPLETAVAESASKAVPPAPKSIQAK